MINSFRIVIPTAASVAACLFAISSAVAANGAKPDPNDICTGFPGSFAARGGVETRPPFESFICQLHMVPPVNAKEMVQAAVPLQFEPAVNIGFTELPNVMLTDVATTSELVEALNFAAPPTIDFSTFHNLAQPASLTAGDSGVWLVTPGGIRVFDAKTKQWSFSAKVTADQVRPKDAILDEHAGSVWFFGRELYQYEIATHKIYRHKQPAKTFHVIRKVAATPGGLWLAADSGIYFFDSKRKVFQQLQAESKLLTQTFTQVAAGKSGVWFSSSSANLLRLQRSGDTVSAQISTSIGGVSPIELVARDDGLWMLHSQDQGRTYRLATVQTGNPMLQVSKNKLFSLREADGQLFASAYDELYRVDTAVRKIALINADAVSVGSLALGTRILFSGTSYVNSNGTGTVARYVLDLSKGWLQPASGIVYDGWGTQQSSYLLEYALAVLEVSSNSREVWFLIAANLENAKFDRTVVARYDKRTGRAEVFFSRWAGDPAQSQPFAVESLSTTVAQREQ